MQQNCAAPAQIDGHRAIGAGKRIEQKARTRRIIELQYFHGAQAGSDGVRRTGGYTPAAQIHVPSAPEQPAPDSIEEISLCHRPAHIYPCRTVRG
jgi:hypothetical protein